MTNSAGANSPGGSGMPDSGIDEAECNNTHCFAIRLGWMWPGFAPSLEGAAYTLETADRVTCYSGTVSNNLIRIQDGVPLGSFLSLAVTLTSGTARLVVYWNLHASFEAGAETSSDALLHAKAMLNNLGIYCGPTDDTFTERTRWALAWFQKKRMNRAVYDGRLDAETMSAIRLAYKNIDLNTDYAAVPVSEPAVSPDFRLRNYLPDVELRREWFHTNTLAATDVVAMDHDPRRADLRPVWGAVEHHTAFMFPDGATQATQAARLFVMNCEKARAQLFQGEGQSTAYLNTLYLPQPVGWLQEHLEELGIALVNARGSLDQNCREQEISCLEQDRDDLTTRINSTTIKIAQLEGEANTISEELHSNRDANRRPLTEEGRNRRINRMRAIPRELRSQRGHLDSYTELRDVRNRNLTALRAERTRIPVVESGTRQQKFYALQDSRGYYGRYTEWSVREFQYYAKMAQVAHEDWPAEDTHAFAYPDRLRERANAGVNEPPEPADAEAGRPWERAKATADGRYESAHPSSGSLNARTGQVIRYWLDKRFRCPVVILETAEGAPGIAPDQRQRVALGLHGCSRRFSGEAHNNNAWRATDVSRGSGVFGMDLSTQWAAFAIDARKGFSLNPSGFVAIIGYLTTWLHGRKLYRGLAMDRDYSLDCALIRRDDLNENAVPGQTQENTRREHVYSIINEMSHYECSKRFDVCNAYDHAGFSFSLYHYILRRSDQYQNDDSYELPGCFAYWRENCADVYNRLIEQVGIRSSATWETITLSKGTYPAAACMQTRTGEYAALRTIGRAEGTAGQQEAFLESEVCFFRTWHSVWRFISAARSSQDFRRTVWRFAKKRLRNILEAPIQTDIPNATTIGDIFQSRCALTILLRVHVYSPGSILNANGNAAQRVVAAANDAYADRGYRQDPQGKLVAKLKVQLGGITSDVERIASDANISQTLIGRLTIPDE